MSSLRTQAVMLDLDGTLVDTMGDFVAVLDLCLNALHLQPLPETVVRTLVGKGSEHLIRSVLARQVPEWSKLESIAQARWFNDAWALYQAHYTRLNGQHSQLFAGVESGLNALHELNLPMACLTNKPLAFAQPLLEQKGIAKFFKHVYGGDSFEHKKPHPLPLLKTCEALGTLPQHTWMVGDSSNDAQAARAAGCPVALLGYGYNHGQPVHECSPDLLLHSLADLPNHLS